MNYRKKYYLFLLFFIFAISSSEKEINPPEDQLGFFQDYEVIRQGTYIIKRQKSNNGGGEKTSIKTFVVEQRTIRNPYTGKNERELFSIITDKVYDVFSDQIKSYETSIMFGTTKLEILAEDILTDNIVGVSNGDLLLISGASALTLIALYNIFYTEK